MSLSFARWAAVAQARPPACLVRGVVLEVAVPGGPSADGAGAGRMPDLGQVPQLDAGVVAAGLVPVVARVSGYRIKSDCQAGPATGDAKPPSAVPSRRAVLPGGGDGNAGPSHVSGGLPRPRGPVLAASRASIS